ncbi:MAG: 2-amino-4-hydroxy-6-hydroxymethyldihydropteridine diphosphokinase [Candidatus Eisenbacteria bacterium]|nr:2-amino-4-hydroxy-6-hydroxymethyldihydropteridine diphosphokinase [Candidatus Eisenbacteria bacterium]
MARAWIGVGSNLGDRLGAFRRALAYVSELEETELIAVSSLYDTEPVGVGEQPRYLNAVAEIETALEPRALMRALLAIEDRCGRVRREPKGPRTMDLDLLVYEDVELDTEELVLPHPGLLERAFALVPLAELAGHMIVPGTELSVRDHLDHLGDIASEIRRIGTPPRVGEPA